MSEKKSTSLEQLKLLANRTKSEVDSLNTKISAITVPTKVSELTNDSGFQTSSEVATAIQAAIAGTGHAHFEVAGSIPTAETAAENVLYLVMNAETGHYDIYALVSGEVVLIDDTTTDLSAYSTTEQMNAAIAAAVEALDYTKTEASQTNGNVVIDGAETTVYTLPSSVLHESNIATDEEVTAMLDEVFGTTA